MLDRSTPSCLSSKLMTKFPEFLKGAAVHCGSSPLVIFLDGLDQMEEAYQAKNMEWLPKELPKVQRAC